MCNVVTRGAARIFLARNRQRTYVISMQSRLALIAEGSVMSSENSFATALPDRGLVHVSGPDARSLLDNTITNAMAQVETPGTVMHAGLLTPQGKILFAFFVVALADNEFLLDTDAASLAGLIQRLSMYRLRSKAEITDVTKDWAVGVCDPSFRDVPANAIVVADPRDARLGRRVYAPASKAFVFDDAALGTYHDGRIANGIADAIADYALGETFTHEANWDEIGSVDFAKGCFIGQEVVSRTRHKSVVRKRIVRVSSAASLTSDAEVKAGEATIGAVSSVGTDGRHGLAMLRIDRALSALDQAKPVHIDGNDLEIDAARLDAYRDGLASKASETAGA